MRKYLILILITLLALAISGCLFQPAPTPAPTKAILKGQVLVPEGAFRQVGGQALPGATVNIIDPKTGEIIATTITDANGKYQVEVPPGGPYIIEAVKGNIKVLDVSPQVEVGQTYDLGTADATSTAVALVFQEKVEAGEDPAQINLDEILEDPKIGNLIQAIEEALAAGKDPTTAPEVTQIVEVIVTPPSPSPAPPSTPTPTTPVTPTTPAPTPTLSPEALALQALKDGTTLDVTVNNNVVTATVKYPETIDPILEDWLADAKLEVGEALPEGTKVDITYNSILVTPEGGVTVGGATEAYLSDLLPEGVTTRPPITAHANREDVWVVTITPGALIDTTLTVKAVISKDSFANEEVIAQDSAELDIPKAANAVYKMIASLPEKFTLADEEAIRAALDAYNKLSANEKVYVTNYSKIENAIVEGESSKKYLSYFCGWPKLKFYSTERGNYVSSEFGFVSDFGTVNQLSELKVSIFKEGKRLATNTLKDPKNHSGPGVTCSFYDSDITETSSWYVEKISGSLGDTIFDTVELKIVKNNKIYIFTSTDMREW